MPSLSPHRGVRRQYLYGGKADRISLSKFNKRDLDAGTRVEMEHTNDRRLAQEIASDHLAEDKDYYRKLAKLRL